MRSLVMAPSDSTALNRDRKILLLNVLTIVAATEPPRQSPLLQEAPSVFIRPILCLHIALKKISSRPRKKIQPRPSSFDHVGPNGKRDQIDIGQLPPGAQCPRRWPVCYVLPSYAAWGD